MSRLSPFAFRERSIPSCGGHGWLLESLLLLKVNRSGHRSGSRAASLRHISSVEIRSGLFGTRGHQGVYGRASRCDLNLMSSLSLIAALDGSQSCYCY